MRNLLRYPITKQEIKECLAREATKHIGPDAPVGGTSGMILVALEKLIEDKFDDPAIKRYFEV